MSDGDLAAGVRTSHRVLLHLYHLGYLGPEEVGTDPFTQSGIGSAVGISQGGLTGVLRRLVAAGALSVSRRHVRGRPRRVNVYTLTASGEEFVRKLRERDSPASGHRARVGTTAERAAPSTLPPTS